MVAKIKRGSWIVTLPLAAAAAVYFVLVFLPSNRAIGEARRLVRQKQESLAESAGLPAELLAAQQELAKTESYIAAWDRRAPASGERSSLHGKIYALAKAAGVATTRFDPEPVVPWATICEIPIVMGCSGSFAEICEFLASIEREAAEIWIASTNIEKIDRANDLVVCEVRLVVFTDNLEISGYVERPE